MKRRGWVLEEVADMDNLRLAYWKACRGGKIGKKDACAFLNPSVNENLLELSSAILNGRVEVGNFHRFYVYEPKKRLIVATSFRERVLHHALMNVCEQDFERYLTDDSYACRKRKGVHAAINKARENHRRFSYCVKLDVRKYFDSVDHDLLCGQLRHMYKDPGVIDLFYKIISSYDVVPGKGLPIGNLTSQHLANHYLGGADHYVRESIGVKAYVRYMDDMMLWGNNRCELLSQASELREYLFERLKLRLKVFILVPTQKYVGFLGYRLSRYGMKLSSGSAHRYIENIKQLYALYDKAIIDEQYMNQHLHSAIDFVDRASSMAVKQRALDEAYEAYQ